MSSRRFNGTLVSAQATNRSMRFLRPVLTSLFTAAIATGVAACSAPSNHAGMNKPMAGMGSMGAMAMGSGAMSSEGITKALSAFLTSQGENPADFTITSRIARGDAQWSISALRPTEAARAAGNTDASYAFMEMPKESWEFRIMVPFGTSCSAASVRSVPFVVRAEILDSCS